MEITIPYASDNERFSVPDANLLSVAMPQDLPGIGNIEASLKQAIGNPFGSSSLQDMVGPGKSVCVLIDDITRPTPTKEIVPILLKELLLNGVSPKDVQIIVATGAHRPLTHEEFVLKLGKQVVDKFRVMNHDPNDKSKLRYLGESSSGTPVYVNKIALEADLMIGVGGISSHRIAGYGGGAKIVLPGISGKETIAFNHILGSPYVHRLGKIDNPARKDMEEAARMANLHMKIDVVQNSRNEVVRIVAGDFIKEHREALKTFDEIYSVAVPEKSDITITGGFPLESAFAFAFKAVCAADLITQEDGQIILVAECKEGFTTSKVTHEFCRQELTAEKINDWVKSGEIDRLVSSGKMSPSGVTWVIAYVIMRGRTMLVSKGMSADEVKEVGMSYASSVQQGINTTLKFAGKDSKINVLPIGGTTLPSLIS